MSETDNPALESFLRGAARRGFDVDRIRAAVAADPDSIEDPEGDVPATWLARFEQKISAGAGRMHPSKLAGFPIMEQVRLWAEAQCHYLDEVAAGRGDEGSSSPALRLVGILGCGKTSQAAHARNLIGRHQAQRRRRFHYQFIRHSEFCIRMNFDQPDWKRDLEVFKKSPLLVLDDFGWYRNDLAHARAITAELVDYRFDKGLPTIFTTNLRPRHSHNRYREEDQFNEYQEALVDFVDARTVDRYQGSRLITMPKTNWREKSGMGRPIT